MYIAASPMTLGWAALHTRRKTLRYSPQGSGLCQLRPSRCMHGRQRATRQPERVLRPYLLRRLQQEADNRGPVVMNQPLRVRRQHPT
jgi:hypothetical protein